MRKTKVRSKTTKGLLTSLFMLFLSSEALSVSQINSEFQLSLPRQFQENLIEMKWESLVNQEFQANWQLPDQEVQTQDIPVKIKNISLKIQTYLLKPSLQNSQTALQLVSKNLRAEINIGEVSVDHIVERNVGGIIGRFRIQASCRDVSMTMVPGQGDVSMILLPSLQGSKAAATVHSVDVSWLPGSWSIAGFHCEGVEGFADILKKEIDKIANDSSQFIEPQKELIRSYVQEYLQNIKIDFSMATKLIVSRPDIRVLMRVDEYLDRGDIGVFIKGHLQIEFLKRLQDDVKYLVLSEEPPRILGNEAELRLPKDFIKEVMLQAYSADSWIHQINSDNLPGFSSLMRSRFIQFFIWPELMNYSKKAKFLFDVYSNKDVLIEGSGLQYEVKANFLSRMQAPRNGQYVPFINFALPFKSKVNLKVANGKASAHFVNPTMNLTPYWDASYVKKYSPYRRLSSSTIRDRIVGAIWGKTVTVDIPSIPIAEGMSLKVKKALTSANQDIFLQLTP